MMFSGRRRREREEKIEPNNLAGRLVTILDPKSVASEAYRTLRANLIYALVDDPPKVIVVSSPGPQEGKSITSANLGVVLAQVGKNVMMVDCDLRKPAVHKIFGLDNSQGLVNVLVRECSLQDAWHEPMAGLKVLTAGPIPPNPAELLSSQRFAGLVRQVREEFDYVLVDAPPVGLVSDPAILSSHGDGVLLVIDAQNTRKVALRQGMRSLEAVGANVLGVVMNRVEASESGYY